MPINKKSQAVWIANVRRPSGALDLFFETAEEAARYDADPDAYAAKHFGLSKREYLEWIELGGLPLCGARTPGGDFCRIAVGGMQSDAAGWRARHRRARCAKHGGRR